MNNNTNFSLMHNLFSPSPEKCNCLLTNSFLSDGWKNNRLFYLDTTSWVTKSQELFAFMDRSVSLSRFKTSIPASYYFAKSHSHLHFFEEYKVLSLSNPIQQLRLAAFFEANVDKLVSIFTNSQSQNNPFLVQEWLKRQNCEAISQQKQDFAFNPFALNIRRELVASLGFRARLDLKINNFLNSIYTHQVANLINRWAKTEFGNNAQKLRDFSIFASHLDINIRNCSLKETKGVLQGPATSLLYGELFLTLIDYFLIRELKKVGINYQYVRNYHAYTFFLENNRDLELVLNIVNDWLLQNKLNINFASLKKTFAPFLFKTFVNVSDILTSLVNQPTPLHFLDQLQKLQSLDTPTACPGVVKHFLSFLATKLDDAQIQLGKQTLRAYLQQPLIFLSLVNLQSERPELTKKVSALLSSQTLVTNLQLLNQVQQQLTTNITNALQEQYNDATVLSQIYLADRLGINLDATILNSVLQRWKKLSAFTILTTLFYLSKLVVQEKPSSTHLQLWEERNTLLDTIFLDQQQWLTHIQKTGHPFDNLENIAQTSIWMLLYESVVRGWYSGSFSKIIEEHLFFQFLLAKGITFLEK